MMNVLAHIRTFIGIADHGSLAAAAKARGLAPSAVTASLQRLEDHVGAKLMLRSTRSLSLTPEGERFLAQCRRIVGDLDEAIDQAADAGPLRGTIRLTSINDFGRSRLAGLIDGPAVYVGNSLGGHLALRLALDHPEAVRGLVLAGSSGLFEREIVVGRTAQHRPSRDWLQQKIEELFSDPANIPEGIVDRVYNELSNRRAARALVRLSKSAKSDNLAAHLSEIQARTMLLWGRDDTVTPPRVAEEFKDFLPNAFIHWLDNAGHAPQIEQAAAFTKAIDDFLCEFDPYDTSQPRQEVA